MSGSSPWGRDATKARRLAAQLADLPVHLEVASELAQVLGAVDLISSATPAREPLIRGELVHAGAHVDLVGGFTPQMREADSELFRRGRAVVDAAAVLESGDIVIPLRDGALAGIPDLTALLREPSLGRTSAAQITIFKSVGTGLADLATARYLVAKHLSRQAASGAHPTVTG